MPDTIHIDSVSYDSYEKLSEYYFNSVDNKPFNALYERPATVSLLPELRYKRVLDAGCAAGWYTKYLIDKGDIVTAVDFSPRMCEMTKRRVGNEALIVNADLNKPLDFINNHSLDIVLSSLTLHYLKNWDVVLHEFNRILKPSGLLVFSVHHPFMDYTVFKRDSYFLTELIEDEWSTDKGKVKVRFYRRPLSEIISSVNKACFIIDKLIEPQPVPQMRIEYPDIYDRLTKRPQFLFIRAIKHKKRECYDE